MHKQSPDYESHTVIIFWTRKIIRCRHIFDVLTEIIPKWAIIRFECEQSIKLDTIKSPKEVTNSKRHFGNFRKRGFWCFTQKKLSLHVNREERWRFVTEMIAIFYHHLIKMQRIAPSLRSKKNLTLQLYPELKKNSISFDDRTKKKLFLSIGAYYQAYMWIFYSKKFVHNQFHQMMIRILFFPVLCPELEKIIRCRQLFDLTETLRK